MNPKSTDSSTTIASWIPKLSLAILLVSCWVNPGLSQENVTKDAQEDIPKTIKTVEQEDTQKAIKTIEIVDNPAVEQDRITVRAKVKDNTGRPVMELWETDFRLKVDNQEVTFENKDWKSPEESTPPPAWIIFLLDFSGSMANPDSRGTTKLEGAINAIREFTEALSDRGGNTQVSIVPFGTPGPDCTGYSVKKSTIDKFFPGDDFKLQNYLDYLAGLTPCASTNLYDPLNRAVRFLADADDPRFQVPEDANQPQPRLSVILLSDGYHNEANEERDFATLARLLQRNEDIVVHTLGYGLTPELICKRYEICQRPVTRDDIGEGPNQIPAEDFVDRKRLEEIAQLTGGVAEFSADAQTVAEKLKLFLNALLGEYEITYTEPNPDRGSKHSVSVIVEPPGSSAIESAPKSYTMTVFGRSLPLPVRLTMIGVVFLALGLGGIIPFWRWGQHLKQTLEQD